MTNQPGSPVTPAAGLAAAATSGAGASDGSDEADTTDGGVPVGEADARADEERASGDAGDSGDSRDSGDSDGTREPAASDVLMPDLLAQHDEDDGVPVGRADADEDRRRAADGD